MMVKILTGPNGHKYACVNNISIHSKYSPQKESDKFIQRKIQDSPSVIIILGPGLGYLIDSCRLRFPNTKIINIFYNNIFLNSNTSNDESCFLFDGKQDLKYFLKNRLHDLDLEGAAVLEWPASARVFPEISLKANAIVRDVFKELHGNFITIDSFGKRMIRNSILNFLFHSNIRAMNPIDRPLLIAASGPTLEKSISVIKEYANTFFILALPSSVEIMNYYNVQYDAVLFTDPGYYANLHSYSLFSNQSSETLIIKNISSAFSSSILDNPTIFLGSANFFEQPYISYYYNDSKYIVPEIGTVAGTAIEISERFSPPFTIVAGLDLSYLDLLSHARPHTFYTYFLTQNYRKNPFLHTLFNRKHLFTESSNAYSTYTAWFKHKLGKITSPVYRLLPNDVDLPSAVPLDIESLQQVISDYRSPTKEIKKHTGRAMQNISYQDKLIHIKNIISVWLQKLSFFKRNVNFVSFNDFSQDDLILNLLYFINPIKLKQLKTAVRDNTDISREIYYNLLHEGDVFIKSILNWLTNL